MHMQSLDIVRQRYIRITIPLQINQMKAETNRAFILYWLERPANQDSLSSAFVSPSS